MVLRPGSRRTEALDLEAARRVVSRAERRALERAEELRQEADEILKAASNQAVDAEVKVREQFAAELQALREELAGTSRRATVAESQLELLRTREAEEGGTDAATAQSGGSSTTGDGGGHATEVAPEAVPGLRVVSTDPGRDPAQLSEFGERLAGDPERLVAATGAAAARLHARAELEMVRCRDEALRILTDASREAEDLLMSAIAAIDRDTAIAAATLEQAERDGSAAAARRGDAEAALEAGEGPAARLRGEARPDADRLVNEARAEADRLVEEARAEAARIVEASRHDAARHLEEALARVDQLSEDARRDATEALVAVRRQLVAEILGLRDAMERARESFEVFLASSGWADSGADPRAGAR